ncbi:MAG: glutathione S-transferase family protein [Xanthomonadales bacterium]|nr:glutathione S-transferase family protein [Xanthomonadales bacterium]
MSAAPPAPRPGIEILGRQSSHYTRQVRMLAHELGIAYTLAPIHDLMSDDPATYGGNPALKLPALRDGDAVVWGSANACRWLARRTPGDAARVFLPEDARDPLCMNAHEVLAHAMAAQVEVVFHEIVSKRPPDATSRKRRASLVGCLAWLDRAWPAIRATLPTDRIALFDLGLFALLEHLPFRNPLDLAAMPRLVAFADACRDRPSAQATPYRFDAPPPEARPD